MQIVTRIVRLQFGGHLRLFNGIAQPILDLRRNRRLLALLLRPHELYQGKRVMCLEAVRIESHRLMQQRQGVIAVPLTHRLTPAPM